MSLEEQRNIGTVPTESLEAYEAYQLGKQELARYTSPSVDQTLRFFTQSTTIDPGFAQAWAKLAHSYLVMAKLTGQDVDVLIQNADEAVQEALRFDDQLSETQTALARSTGFLMDDWT